MATAIKFRGVPKTFTTTAAALRFLRNSPGYVERQGDYLRKYWPGVMAELEKPSKAATVWAAPRTIFIPPALTGGGSSAGKKPAAKTLAPKPRRAPAPTLEQDYARAVNRREVSLGLPAKGPVEANIADAVPEPRRGGGTWSLDPLRKQLGMVEGLGRGVAAATEGAARDIAGGISSDILNTLGAAQSGGGPTRQGSPLPPAAQRAANVMQPTANRLVSTTSGLADFTLGKGIPNLIQGQPPKNWQDIAGLGIGAASVLPVGKGIKAAGKTGRALRASLDAGGGIRTAKRTGKLAHAFDNADPTDLNPAAFQAVHVNPGLITADDAAWAKNEFAARGGATGTRKKSALPPTIRSARGLENLYVDLRRRLVEGWAGAKNWYPESGAAIRFHSGGNLQAADELAALTAIYSPQQAVVPNIGLALKAKQEWMLNKKVTVGSSWQNARAELALRGEDWMAGYSANEAQKIRRFYGNLLKHIDPELMRSKGFTGREVTADGWIAAAFGHGSNTDDAATFTPDGYLFMERTIQRLADEFGIEPEAAQAAIWASIKANNDRLLRAKYLNPQTRAQALADAGVHYQAGLERPSHTVKIPVGAENADHILDALHAEGFTARLADNALEIGVGTRPTSGGKAARLAIPPEHSAFYDGLAATVGGALERESVGWISPLVPKAKQELTYWRIDGAYSPGQLAAIDDALKAAGGYATYSDGGFMAVMSDPSAVHAGTVKNGGFASTIDSLVAEHGGIVRDAGTHQGGQVERQGYRRAIRSAGRPDLLRRVADRISSGASAARTAASTRAAEGVTVPLPRPPSRKSGAFGWEDVRIGGRSTLSDDVGADLSSSGTGRANRGGSPTVAGRGVGEGVGGTPAGAPGGARAGRPTAKLVPRTPEAVDARIAALEAKFDKPLAQKAAGLRAEGVGRGERPSMAREIPRAFSYGEREQMIQAEHARIVAQWRKNNPGKAYPGGSWEDLAIRKYGAYESPDGGYLGFDEHNVNLKKFVETDRTVQWYRDEAQSRIRAEMVALAAKGDMRAQKVVAALDELESLKRLRAKNAGAALFPEDVPVGGYGADLMVERAVPAPAAAGSPPVPPELPPTRLGAAGGPPQGPKTLIETVQESVQAAKPVREAQEAGYSAERSQRLAQAMDALETIGGVEGKAAAAKALRGELPKLDWNGFAYLDQDAYAALIDHAVAHPDLRPWEKIRTIWGLERAMTKGVPTRSEIALFERAFGKPVADNLGDAKNMGIMELLHRYGLQVWNVPRTLLASFDLSAPFRQGLVAGARHPVIFAKNFLPMVRAFGKEEAYLAVMDDIASRPNFSRYEKAKLAITDVKGSAALREEQFPGSLVDAAPGVKNSGRAYSAFLNKMRVDVFDQMIDLAAKQDKNVDDPEFLDALGRYINASTGRGKLPWKTVEQAAPFLNSFLFSPRLMASRIAILNPGYYVNLYRQSPFVARQAAIASLNTLAGISTMLYLASNIAGVKVGTNPLSADFGKIRIRDTRIDIAGGFQAYLVLYARLIQGKSVSSSSGKQQDLKGGFGSSSRKDVLQRFIEGKFAPTSGMIRDALQGQTFIGDPITATGMAYNNLTPLNAQGAYDVYQTEGSIPAAAAGALLGSIGFGVGSYPDKAATGSTSTAGGKPGSRSSRLSPKPSRRSLSNKP